MTTTKKTAKYYREILAGNDIRKSLEVMPEVIKKYGYKWYDTDEFNNTISVRDRTEFCWNHRINKFYIGEWGKSKGKLMVDIYWQGDSTDGNTSEFASNLVNGKVIPAEHDFVGDRTYCRHGDLRISVEEVRDALHAVAEYLSSAEMEARKEVKTK